MLSSLNAVISTNESTRIKTGHVIYNPDYTYKFQLKTTQELKQCNKSAELYQHIETYMKVLQRKLDQEVEDFGCLKKNCVENKWMAEIFTQQA